jgi:hypothetical protein
MAQMAPGATGSMERLRRLDQEPAEREEQVDVVRGCNPYSVPGTGFRHPVPGTGFPGTGFPRTEPPLGLVAGAPGGRRPSTRVHIESLAAARLVP